MIIELLKMKNKQLFVKVDNLTLCTKKLIRSHNKLAANFLEASIATEPELIGQVQGQRAAANFAKHIAEKSFRAAEQLVAIQMEWTDGLLLTRR